ncbi:uncharacterized protein LOC108101712 [Drosophila ficusphila]|uniref:uncharacterized protein LOC108101712 n=1 Tax=Drosophila ficusphila TaxID=30025 RepID=UPI001C8A845E|nr:uncharacterized protein LOC108101712 [Drosophila ficusphila]
MNNKQEYGQDDEHDQGAAGGDTSLQNQIVHDESVAQHVVLIGLDDRTFRGELADVSQGVAGTTLRDMEQKQVGTKMAENFSRVEIADIMAVVEPFSGEDGMPVKLWIEEFETACAVLGVPLNRYWLYARRLLVGAAKSYFTYQRAADWDALRAQMMDVFGRKNTKLEICEQLRHRKKKSDESAFRYFIAMCGIARQAELEDRHLIKHIVSGLNDKSGITASLYFCENLDQLRRRLIEYDQIRISLPNSNTGRGTSSAQEFKCYNCHQPGHMVKDCNKPIRPPNSCFNCGGLDHQFRNCPKRVTGRLQQTVASVEDQQAVADIIGKHLPG